MVLYFSLLTSNDPKQVDEITAKAVQFTNVKLSEANVLNGDSVQVIPILLSVMAWSNRYCQWIPNGNQVTQISFSNVSSQFVESFAETQFPRYVSVSKTQRTTR